MTAPVRTPRVYPAPADVVPTRWFKLAQLACADLVDGLKIGLVTGDPGVGKTHALRHFTAGCALPAHRLVPPEMKSPKPVLVRMLRAVAGGCDSSDTVYDLEDELVSVLSERPRAVVVDEAHRMNALHLNQLRSLHDHEATQFALILVGGVDCAKVIRRDPHLSSRVARHVHFQRLSNDDLLDTLRAYHPLLEDTARDVIEDVDREFCRGVFRRWEELLSAYIKHAPAFGYPDKLTRELVKAVLAMMPTGTL